MVEPYVRTGDSHGCRSSVTWTLASSGKTLPSVCHHNLAVGLDDCWVQGASFSPRHYLLSPVCQTFVSESEHSNSIFSPSVSLPLSKVLIFFFKSVASYESACSVSVYIPAPFLYLFWLVYSSVASYLEISSCYSEDLNFRTATGWNATKCWCKDFKNLGVCVPF